MISLVMFDMDGTLFDTEDGLVKTLNGTLEHYGIEKIPKEEIRKLIGPRLYDTFTIRFKQNHEKATEMTEYFRNLYSEKYVFEGSVYPEIEDLLKKLKKNGFKTAIITNKREDYLDMITEHFGLKQYFDKMYGTDFENKIQKWELINRCLNDFNIEKENAVLIGDTKFDKDAAEKSNVKFIPVSHGYGNWENEKCYSVEDLENFLLE